MVMYGLRGVRQGDKSEIRAASIPLTYVRVESCTQIKNDTIMSLVMTCWEIKDGTRKLEL